jgi:hypothetical protein
MTEQEWQTSEQVTPMLRHLDGKISTRKLRLFACACCRSIRHLFKDEAVGRMIEYVEHHADTAFSLSEYFGRWNDIARDQRGCLTSRFFVLIRTTLAPKLTTSTAVDIAQQVWLASDRPGAEVNDFQTRTLCCIVGNPFRPVSLNRSRLTATVVALARGAYDDCTLPAGTLDCDRLAVLADALEDAGCSEPSLLDHLRGPGPHVRGCWAVDLLLGKE